MLDSALLSLNVGTFLEQRRTLYSARSTLQSLKVDIRRLSKTDNLFYFASYSFPPHLFLLPFASHCINKWHGMLAGLVRCSPGPRGFIIWSGCRPLSHGLHPWVPVSARRLCVCQARAMEPAREGTFWLGMVLGSSGETRDPHSGDQRGESMRLSW